MLIRSLFAPLILLFGSQVAHAAPIEIDVNDFNRIDRGGGTFQTAFNIPGTGISQLTPGSSYSIDIIFKDGESYGVESLFPLDPRSLIQLSFGRVTGSNPELGLSSGTVEFTGVEGDFIPSSYIRDLRPPGYVVDPVNGLDFVILDTLEILTTTGFTFTGLNYDFTLAAGEGSAYNVGFIGFSIWSFEPVPAPGTVSLLVLGLLGLVLSQRKRV